MKRALIYLVLGIFILMGASYFYLAVIDFEKQGPFIDEENVRGSSVTHQNREYTLNFDQQKRLVEELNAFEKVTELLQKEKGLTEVNAIYLYRFKEQKPIVLKPLNDDYSLFSVSTWKENQLLKLQDSQRLVNLLQESYTE